MFLRLLIIFFFSTCGLLDASILRAAIDFGSAGPKLRVAEIEPLHKKIVKVVHAAQYPVIFEESFSQSCRILSQERMQEGIRALKEAIATAHSYGAHDIMIMGTSVFRNTLNGKQFAQQIQLETGLPVHILDQEWEAKLAFQGALAKIDVDCQDLIVWDIGGGSTQFIQMTAENSYLIHGSEEGSGYFRDFIIETIQQKSTSCKSPNPLSSLHAVLAESQARALSEKASNFFKNKVNRPQCTVVGVGSVFGRGIASLMAPKNPFTIEDLSATINHLIGKTDADLGGGDFACIEVSNALLVLGFMKNLGIQQMYTMNINNTDGALVFEPFWQPLANNSYAR